MVEDDSIANFPVTGNISVPQNEVKEAQVNCWPELLAGERFLEGNLTV